MSDRTLKDKNKDEDKNAVASKSSENIRNDTFHKRYKIIEKIGEGSYSEVLKCENRDDKTVVACKRLKHLYRCWSHVHEISEIATLRAIQKHTNILQMLEIHYDEKLGKVSLVFELMDVNLYELIKDRKRLLPETRVRTIIFQLFRALRHLHKLGIFHRDIKPENILIKLKTDQLKLGDLGSVRGMFSRPPYTEYISTRWYRSPECLLTAGHYSNKMDIWAAGCVFYEVLTLRPLFPGSSELDQINRINNILGPPPIKLLETFQNKADVERDTFRNQNQKARRQQIQKVLDGYKSKYILQVGESKSNSNKSLRTSKNSLETGPVYFSERTGTGLEKMLPSHITREAREIIKNCLAYDPEQRPSAQRTIQLPYFYELRESYAKNPEKVSSKPVVAICDETVMEYREPIDLGTLGDNKKKRHHRPQHQTVVQEVYRKSKDSSKISPKKGSSKLEVNNNNYTSSPNNSIGSLSRISNISRVQGSKTNLTKQQVLQVRKSEDTLPTDSYGKLHNSRNLVNAETSRSSYKVVSSSTGNARSKNNFETEVRKRIHSTSYESIQSEGKQKGKNALEEKSFSTINTVSLNEKVVSTRRLKDSVESLASIDTKMSKDSESCTTASRKDFRRSNNALNNNTVRQSQEKLRKTNASSHKMEHVGQNIKKSVLPSDVSPYMQAPSELKFLQKKIKSNTTKKPTNLVFNHPQQQQQQQTVSSQMDKGRVQQNNGKHESTKVSVVPPKVAAAAIKYAKSLNQNNSAAVARQLREVLGDAPTARSGAYSPNESSYAASSVKVGKLRFRQAQHQTTKGRASPDNYQRSKIPVPIDDGEISRKSYKSSKLTSPPQSIREKDITDKWRNTGIPRMIPMSPERERNINLIRESLTMDKNKRLKIRQEAINNSHKNDFEYDPLASQDTSQHQQRVTETYSSGRYLNSTTDYENIECQETSSSAAPAENHIFEQRTMMIKLPELTEEIKKPGLKSSGMYSDLHEGSRYKVASSLAATDVNMNILNDGGGYKKRPDRNEDIKEKLDQKIHTQRHKNSSSVGDRDHTKLARESRNYEYNRYSSGVATNNRPSGSTLPREDEPLRRKRPPVPPTKIHGSRNADMNKEHQRREHSPEPLTMKIGPPYHHAKRANRTSEAVKEYSPKHSKKTRRTAETRKEYKEHGKRRSGRMKSTMRVVRGEEVWCSSDDDIMETMRKKFDDLISERARRLTESLKTHPIPISNEARKACNSRSEDDVSIKRLGIEKPIKYARRQLRARMAESLIANNYPNWRDALPDHLTGQNLHLSHGLIQNNTSNNSGDFVAPSHDTRTMRESEEKYHDKQRQPAVLDLRQSKKDYHDGHNFKNRRGDESRLYSFLQDSNKGQIYTPQGNKPVYQSPPSQVGATLNDRKLRYSHNSLVPVANHSTYTQRRNHNEDDIRNRRRI